MPVPVPDRPYWSFPALSARQFQQFVTVDASGIVTASRQCTKSTEFFLVRYHPDNYHGLEPGEKRFIVDNVTPREADDAV